MTPPGIEPATFRLVAHGLNELRHRLPAYYTFPSKKKITGVSKLRRNAETFCQDYTVSQRRRWYLGNAIYEYWA
jgi:hypothetical protein